MSSRESRSTAHAGRQVLAVTSVQASAGTAAGPEDGDPRRLAAVSGSETRPALLFGATRDKPGGVVVYQADGAYLEDLASRAIERQRPGSLPRSKGNQKVLDAWETFLGPHFDATCAVNLTGTYRNDYGYSHGLMLARNVVVDFLRVLKHEQVGEVPWCIGTEQHRTGRDILHFHAMVGGDWDAVSVERLEAYWLYSRGWAVAKLVSDAGGCVGYCAKHLLKRGAADNFEFRLPSQVFGSRYARRQARMESADRKGSNTPGNAPLESGTDDCRGSDHR
jgi:hypothetical protein